MFARIVKESFVRSRRRKFIAIAAIALGSSVATAMLAVALGIGDKVNRELRSYGANIEVLPQVRSMSVSVGGIEYKAASENSYIKEPDLLKLRSIFWANNIIGFAPSLRVPVTATTGLDPAKRCEAVLLGAWFEQQVTAADGKPFVTGVKQVSPWWKVDGEWPKEGQCLIGVSLAETLAVRPGTELSVVRTGADGQQKRMPLRVSGLLSTGATEDDQLVAELSIVQELAGLNGLVDRVEVSALTNPEDAFAKSDPSQLSPQDYERWSCTPYAQSIAYDIGKAINGVEARPVLRISQTEGALLTKVELMMMLVTLAALVASVLGVTSTMMTTVLERRSEIGLLKAIGAGNAGVLSLFLAEAAIVGTIGGAIGLGAGYLMGQFVASSVFGSSIGISGVLVPLVFCLSIGVAFAGSLAPLRTALKFDPATVLRM